MVENEEKKEQEPTSLAFEIYQEQKEQNKRLYEQNKSLFRTIWILIACLVISNAAWLIGHLWYASLPVEESSVEQSAEGSGINYNVGGDYHGDTPENILQTESGAN